MAQAQLDRVVQHIRRLAAPPRAQEAADAELLRSFLERRDESAFSTLLERYGRLVMRVCRRVLGQEQDAEDAFQATFLVLARKAGAIRCGAALPAWLHGVAYNMALKARRSAARRRTYEMRVPVRPGS